MGMAEASKQDIDEAIGVVKRGGVIVFPTETAYGLGADATNAQAVARLMAIKGREAWKTPPLIAATQEMAEQFVKMSDRLQAYTHQCWPGPLTIVALVKKETTICLDVIREGTIAIRVSSHPIARLLSEALGVPLVATSANVAGQPTCFAVEDIRAQFDSRLLQPDFYLNVGSLQDRGLSTIISEQNDQIILIRKGMIEIPRYVT